MDIATEVARAKVINFIASLGIDVEVVIRDVCLTTITPDEVIITQFRRDATGHHTVIDDKKLATTTTTIAIK